MCDNVRGNFRKLQFPEPYDSKHPQHPHPSGVPLVTKRILTMDRCSGKTVTKFGQAMLDEAAAAKGMTVEEVRSERRGLEATAKARSKDAMCAARV